MLGRTPSPPPPSASPTLNIFRSLPCLLHSPILSPPCLLPPAPHTHRAAAPSSSSPICIRRASVPTPRPMCRWTPTGSPTATACRHLTRRPQKTSIRRTSSSSKVRPAALGSTANRSVQSRSNPIHNRAEPLLALRWPVKKATSYSRSVLFLFQHCFKMPQLHFFI